MYINTKYYFSIKKLQQSDSHSIYCVEHHNHNSLRLLMMVYMYCLYPQVSSNLFKGRKQIIFTHFRIPYVEFQSIGHIKGTHECLLRRENIMNTHSLPPQETHIFASTNLPNPF